MRRPDTTQWLGGLSTWLLSRPLVTAGILVAVTLASLGAMTQLRSVAGLEVYIDKERPMQAVVDRIDAHFVNDDVLFIGYRSPQVFSRASLEEVRRLGQWLEALQVEDESGEALYPIDDVQSLATVDDLVGSDMTFRNVPLVPDPIPDAPEALALMEARARNNPLIADQLLSPDPTVAALVLRLAAGLDDAQKATLVETIRERLAGGGTGAIERYAFMGAAVLDADTAVYQAADLQRFIPLVYLVLALLLFLFLRTLRGVVMALLTVGIALGAAMGCLVLIGGTINNTSVLLPPAMMALTVAMMVHYASEYGKHASAGADAPRKTLTLVIPPVFMASVTTAIGFGSLAVSNIPAVKQFGRAAGLSMLVAFVVGTLAVALAWRFWPPERFVSPKGLALDPKMDGALAWVAELVIRRPRWIILGAATLFVVVLFGARDLTPDQDTLGFFNEDTPVRQDNAFIETHLGGTTPVVVSIETEEAGRFLEPRELEKLVALERFLEDELAIAPTVSIAGYLQLMHREFMDGDPEAYQVPATLGAVSQLMLLNGDETVDEYLDGGQRWVRVLGRTRVHTARGLSELYERIDAYLAREFPGSEGYKAVAAADSRLSALLIHDLITSQIKSVGLSVVLIFGLMFLMLRSWRLGIISLAPNLFPILANLGVMGWTDVPLDAATGMISTVALGIAVDDTIHFLQMFRRRLHDHGDTDRAIRETFRFKGPGMVGTSVVLAAAFSVLVLSNFGPSRDFAVLMCLIMGSALAGDLLLLPAILKAFEPTRSPETIPQPQLAGTS